MCLTNNPISLAKMKMASGNYTEALEQLESVDNGLGLFLKGYCYYKLEDCVNAGVAFQAFMDDPGSIQGLVKEATYLLNKCQNSSNQRKAGNEKEKVLATKNKFSKVDFYKKRKVFHKDSLLNEKRSSLLVESKRTVTLDPVLPKDVTVDLEQDVSNKVDDNEPMVENILKKADDNEPMGENPIPIEPEEQTNKTHDNPPMVENVISKEDEENPRKKDDNEPMTENVMISTDQKPHFKILFSASADDGQIFISLTDLGPVTTEKDDIGITFYYLGNFENQEEALLVGRKVKSRGFLESTVVEFNQGKMIEEYEIESKDQEGRVEEDLVNQNPVSTPSIPELKKEEITTYHILFRVLDNPYQVFPYLEKLGPLYRETFDRQGNSRYLIGEETSIKKARKLLKKVKKSGYPSSIIVEYVNGEMMGAVE